jgi:hypothetical protein
MNTAKEDVGRLRNDYQGHHVYREKRDGEEHSCTGVVRIINPRHRVVGCTYLVRSDRAFFASLVRPQEPIHDHVRICLLTKREI